MDEPERLTIGELSQLTGCAIETIRYYERAGVLRPPSRTQSGRRHYGREDVEQLTMVRRARDLGFPLAQITRLLTLAKQQPADHGQAKAIAEAHLDDVRRRILDLEEAAGRLRNLLETADILAALAGKQQP